MAPKNISFIPDKHDGGSAASRFQDLLKTLSNQSKLATPILTAIEKKQMTLKAFRPIGADTHNSSMYLFMLVGHNDFHLEKLGRDFDMPRGFPMLWWPENNKEGTSHQVKFFGFRRKFKNDERQGAIPLDACGAAWFKKVSGFHCHLITFQYSGDKCWAALSKNSASISSDFVVDATRVLEPYVTDSLWNNLDKIKGHVNFELISKNDQVHGNIVDFEVPVAVSLGLGASMDIIGQSFKEYNSPKKGFVRFFGFRDTIMFCLDNKLPVLDAVLTTREGTKYLLSKFQSERDNMDDAIYEQIVEESIALFPKNIELIKGNIKHKKFAGKVLEGLVIHGVIDEAQKNFNDGEIISKLESGETEIIKVKCPRYNYVTMLIREFLNLLSKKKVTMNDFHRYADHWAEKWCVTQSGAKFWIEMAWETILLAVEKKLVKLYPIIKSQNPLPGVDDNIGLHIRAANWANTHGPRANIDNVVMYFKKASTMKSIGVTTVVMPFVDDKTLELERNNLQGYGLSVVMNKAKPKIKDGWIVLSNIPTTGSQYTGKVYQYPSSTKLKRWQLDKLACVENVINVKSREDLIERIQHTNAECEHTTDIEENKLSLIEKELRDSVEKTSVEVEAALNNNRRRGERTIILLIAPQCIGKTMLTKRMSKLGVVQCSADLEMFKDGKKFNWARLSECHSKCQLNCLRALEDGLDVCIDNTNMVDCHRTIYKKISSKINSTLMPVVLAPECWLTCNSAKRSYIVRVLEKRSEMREESNYKKIDRKVIERTIEAGVENLGVKGIDEWITSYPIIQPSRGISWDKNALVYKCPKLNKISIEYLNGPIIQARPNIEDEIMMFMIMRGVNNYHCTLIRPKEGASLKMSRMPISIPKIEEVPPPNVVGVGSISKEDNCVVYLVLEWTWGDDFRCRLGLPKQDFHVTLAFAKNDIHDMPKGLETLHR